MTFVSHLATRPAGGAPHAAAARERPDHGRGRPDRRRRVRLTSAIILYEAALGLGIASGPLLGGLIGGASIGFVLITVMLGPVPEPARRVSRTDPLKALGPRSMAIVAVLSNFGFFTILAYTPFPLGLSAHQLGIVYFGWGLVVAL